MTFWYIFSNGNFQLKLLRLLFGHFFKKWATFNSPNLVTLPNKLSTLLKSLLCFCCTTTTIATVAFRWQNIVAMTSFVAASKMVLKISNNDTSSSNTSYSYASNNDTRDTSITPVIIILI